MTTRARLVPGDGDPRHGTANGYCNLQCRCEACRTAWRAYNTKARRTRRDLLPYRADSLSHGSASTYQNHGCRCLACREAKSASYRKHRAMAAALSTP